MGGSFFFLRIVTLEPDLLIISFSSLGLFKIGSPTKAIWIFLASSKEIELDCVLAIIDNSLHLESMSFTSKDI